MAIPYVVGGLSVALLKRKQNRQKQAAANAFSQKYPLLDDIGQMDASINAALLELKNIEAAPAKTAAVRNAKKRNTSALKSWLLVMREHRKDLKSGINVATTQVTPMQGVVIGPESKLIPTATTVVMAEEVKPIQTVLPEVQQGSATQEPKDLSQINTETDVKNTGNLAAGTKEKGVNWLLIGGIAVAVYFGYKYFKK